MMHIKVPAASWGMIATRYNHHSSLSRLEIAKDEHESHGALITEHC
jgi:hypothetical protein